MTRRFSRSSKINQRDLSRQIQEGIADYEQERFQALRCGSSPNRPFSLGLNVQRMLQQLYRTGGPLPRAKEARPAFHDLKINTIVAVNAYIN